MKKIEVFGPGCAKCRKSYETACRVVETRGIDAEVVKIEDLDEIVARGILRTPAVLVDGKQVVVGRVLRERDLEAHLDE